MYISIPGRLHDWSVSTFLVSIVTCLSSVGEVWFDLEIVDCLGVYPFLNLQSSVSKTFEILKGSLSQAQEISSRLRSSVENKDFIYDLIRAS